MGFFKSIQKIISKANNVVNDVMKVVDPVGAYLKVQTETKSQAAVASLLGANVGTPNASADLGGTPAVSSVSDESIKAAADTKFDGIRKRRQGVGGAGSTLLTTADDDNLRLGKSTLLGM